MIPAWLLALVESLAYAAARGVTRAWLDVLREGTTATNEVPDAADAAVGARFRAAVQRVQPGAAGSGAPRPAEPAPASQASDAHGVGPTG